MTPDIMSPDESHDLVRLEPIITKGLQTFLEIGDALAEIRERKLYRIEHATFDAYLKSKWAISRSRALRLIHAAETMLPAGNKPTTERNARPLINVCLLRQRIDWFKATERRGFPMGNRRGRRLPLAGLPKQGPPQSRRNFVERVRIIHREIDAMTNDEQLALLRMNPIGWPQFREENIISVLIERAKRDVPDSPSSPDFPG